MRATNKELTVDFGNMTLVSVDEGTCNLKCHCGTEFTASARLTDNQIPVRGQNGIIHDLDGDAVTCPKCDCRWKQNKRTLPELPDWKFFTLYVSIDGQELPAVTGLDTNIRKFAAFAIMQMSTCEHINNIRVEEIDEEKYNELLDKSDNEQRRLMMGGLFGLLFGK